MTYRLTAEHDELRAVVRELAEERIAPRAAEIDATGEFPWDLTELLAKQALLGTGVEERPGGTGLDSIGQCILVEEIARADATTSLIAIVQKLGALPILLAGSDDVSGVSSSGSTTCTGPFLAARTDADQVLDWILESAGSEAEEIDIVDGAAVIS